MNQSFAETLRDQLDELVQRYAERLASLTGTFYERMAPEERQAAARRTLSALIDDLTGSRPIEEFSGQLALERARSPQYTISAYKTALGEIHTLVRALIADHYPENSQERSQALADLNDAMLRNATGFYESYTEERERVLREREAQLMASAEEQEKLVSILRELSSPIVPVHDSILVLPLVGAIDTARAQTITEDLLEAIVARQADIVIIDITGVPVVDTAIANYLVQTTKAVNLLGAQVILVGISAEVAQTIVGLDLDLNRLTVRANLQDGIDFALNQLGLQIASTAPSKRA